MWVSRTQEVYKVERNSSGERELERGRGRERDAIPGTQGIFEASKVEERSSSQTKMARRVDNKDISQTAILKEDRALPKVWYLILSRPKQGSLREDTTKRSKGWRKWKTRDVMPVFESKVVGRTSTGVLLLPGLYPRVHNGNGT